MGCARSCFCENKFYCLFAPYKITRVSFKLDSPYRARWWQCVQGEQVRRSAWPSHRIRRIISVATLLSD